MSKELRKTGLEVVGDVPWGTHFCQFYKTPQDLLDILVPYFTAGLKNNEFCMWVTSEPLGEEAARAALAAAWPGFEDCERRGQIEIIPHTDWYLKGGQFDSGRVLNDWVRKLGEARSAGYEGLRLTGNTFWLEPKDWRGFTDYEAAVDGVIGNYRMLAVCTYSIDRCASHEILDVISNHRFALVRREGRWELIESGERKRAYEEIRRLAQFPEQNPNPVLRVTIGGEIMFANLPARALLAAMGWREGTLIPASLLVLVSGTKDGEGSVEAELGDQLGKTYWFAAVHPAGESYVNLYARDITGRKNAEEAVRQSREWLRVTMTSIGDAVIATDTEGRITFFNPVASALTGWPPEEAVGRPIGEVFQIINEITRQPAEDIVTRVLSERRPVSLSNNTSLLARDGREVPIEDSAAPILGADGGLNGVVLVFHDVTAKRQAQRELRASEEKYRLLFQNMGEGFALHEIITDDGGRPIDYRFLDLNPSFERLTGLPGEGILGKRVTEVLPGIGPFWIDTYGRVALTGEPATFVRYFPAPLDRWYEVYAYRPAPRQFAVIFKDVTEGKRTEAAQQESERRLREARALLEAVTSGTNVLIATVDKDYRYTFFNDEHHRELKRLTGKETRIGMSLMEVLADMPAERDKALALWGRALSGETVIQTLSFGGPGRYRRWYNTRHTPIRDAAGAIVGAGEVTTDVTELMQAQEDLRQSREDLNRAQEVGRIGWWRLDTRSNILTWSDENYRIFGLPTGTPLTYETFLGTVHPDDRLYVDAKWNEGLRGEPYDIEHRILTDGPEKWVREKAYLEFDDAGNLLGGFGITQDITDRKLAQEALRVSEKRLRNALDSARLGTFDSNLETPALILDEQTKRTWGIPLEEQPDFTQAMELIHPDDRRQVQEALASAFDPAGSGDYEAEHRIVRADGTVCWNQAKGRVFFAGREGERRPVRLVGVNLDITEQKRSEELRRALAEQERLRLGAAVEQASDSVVMVDLDGTIRYVNTAFESINRMPREEAAGRSYLGFLAGNPAAEAIGESLAKGRAWHGQITRTIPGCRPLELEVTISSVADPSGAVIGGLVTEKDITHENALQRQVRQAQKMEALGTLAGGIAHDFNNVLGAITINTELALLDLEQSHPALEVLRVVLQAANRGKELIKQIITFSRQREWERKPLEISPVVKEAVNFLRSTLPKDVVIHERTADGCGSILGDPSQIHQILVNLCQNATQAMEEHGGILDVKLGPMDVDSAMVDRHPDLRPGRYVRLTVADTGRGMSRDLIDRIFEPFFTTRGSAGGTGLGLAVVHSIVRGYKGAITVYSEPGRGSVFNVYFPQHEAGITVPDAEKPIEEAGGHERILLVEDESAQRLSLARGLKRFGFKVTARAGGRSALAAFRKDPGAFDIVITDQTMPGMTGLELAAAMVRVRPDIPIILCTGFSEKVSEGTIGQSGVREFLMKPFTLQEILRLISKAQGTFPKGTP